MPRVSEMIEKKYLQQNDIGDGYGSSEQIVTIRGMAKRNIAKENEKPEERWLIAFVEHKRPMVLNNTNLQLLGRILGDEANHWIGKKVVLYVDPTIVFGGKVVGGLRFRPVPGQDPLPIGSPAATPVPPSDDPFPASAGDLDDDIDF